LKKIKIKEPFDIINGADPLLASPIQANGLISRTMGDSLAIAPPLIIKASQVNDMLGLIKQSLDETLKILVGLRLKIKT
jgi:4-aminobutyrate--pyruvate transaminase